MAGSPGCAGDGEVLKARVWVQDQLQHDLLCDRGQAVPGAEPEERVLCK